MTLSAQSVSTQGKEFWLSFMQNGYYENNSGSIPDGVIPQLTVSAKRQCSVSVTNPSFPEWSMNFQVEANGIQQQNLPKQYSYHMGSDNETLSNKGIHIVATDTISVYCANIANYSFDASFVLPIDGLGDIAGADVQVIDRGDFKLVLVVNLIAGGAERRVRLALPIAEEGRWIVTDAVTDASLSTPYGGEIWTSGDIRKGIEFQLPYQERVLIAIRDAKGMRTLNAVAGVCE